MATSSKVNESILQRGLEGKLTSEEFHKNLEDYVKDFNAEQKKQTECATASDKFTLDFLLNGGLVPVADFEETAHNHKDRTDTITITNNSKKKLYVELQYVPNPKFKMEITPPVAELAKKGGSATIEFRIKAFCTTKIYQLIRVSLSEKKKDVGKSGFGIFGSKTKQPLTMAVYNSKQLLGPQEGEVGAFYFWFKVESELSCSIDYDEIVIPNDPSSVLGKGGFGTVYRGTWRNSEVAVKRLNTEELVEEELAFVKREMHTMTRLNHKYVIITMGYTQVPGQPLSIIMEFVKGGSLTKLLQQPLDDQFKAKLALDCAKGLAYLHAAKINHRDIKPDNLLVVSKTTDAEVNLKITDFGTSKAAARSVASYASRKDLEMMREMKEPKPSMKKIEHPPPVSTQSERTTTKGVGTPIYSAPEILSGHTLEPEQVPKTDIYSFGVMLLQIFTGIEPYSQPPFDKYDKWKLEGYITSGKRLPIPPPPIVPDKIKTLIEECWAHSASKRPDVNYIVKYLEDLMPHLSDVKPTGPNNNNAPAVGPPSGNNHLQVHQEKPRTLSMGGNSSPGPSSPPLNMSKADNSIGEFLPEKTIMFPHGQPPVETHNLLPTEDPVDLGYCGEISREETAAKLHGQADGTYLVRWSTKTASFVLSFVKNGKDVQHIAFIKRNPKSEIVVDKQGGGTCTYANLNEYVSSMKKTGVISAPIPIVSPQPVIEDLYVLSHN